MEKPTFKPQMKPSKGALRNKSLANFQKFSGKSSRNFKLKLENYMTGDMVKHELRVTSCELRVTSYDLNA